MNDFFQPKNEPAKSIYDAFKQESTKRSGRTCDEWMSAERNAVFNAAMNASQRLGIKAPTIEEVEKAERCACGHTDYGAQWAYGVALIMKRNTDLPTSPFAGMSHSRATGRGV